MPIPSQNPQWASQLRNQADVQGKVGLSLDEIVVPVAVVADDDELVWEGISTGKAWGGGTTNLPTVGERISVRLLNEAGSGTLIHVELIQLRSATIPSPGLVRFATGPAVVGTPYGTVQVRDLRRGADFFTSPVGVIHEESGPGILPNEEWTDVVDSTGFPTRVPLDVWLPPGSSIVAQLAIADERLEAFWQWTERPLRTAERAKL